MIETPVGKAPSVIVIFASAASIQTSLKSSLPSKISPPMLITPLPILTEVKLLFLKAYGRISVTLSGIWTMLHVKLAKSRGFFQVVRLFGRFLFLNDFSEPLRYVNTSLDGGLGEAREQAYVKYERTIVENIGRPTKIGDYLIWF